MREIEQKITPEQQRLAFQFEHSLQSYYYTKQIVEENGDDGVVFDTGENGVPVELLVDKNMQKGLQRVIGTRFKDLRETGDLGNKIARDIVSFVNKSRQGT